VGETLNSVVVTVVSLVVEPCGSGVTELDVIAGPDMDGRVVGKRDVFSGPDMSGRVVGTLNMVRAKMGDTMLVEPGADWGTDVVGLKNEGVCDEEGDG